MTKILLHMEGLAVFLLSIYFYGINDFSWLWFIILLLLPDVSMLGYMINDKIGAVIYNVFHTYITAIIIIFLGVLLSSLATLAIGMIWTAHIGMDRMFGYGLKYSTGFKDNHLGSV